VIRPVRRASPSSRFALLALLAVTAIGCSTARENASANTPVCQQCHGGDSGNNAPPRSVTGETDTTAIGVGAHQAHLTRSDFTAVIACSECHVVPDIGIDHVNGVATVTFAASTRARYDGADPRWNRSGASGTCSNVYCHGATLGAGGAATTPTWNAAGQAHLGCGSCHGFPPANHGAITSGCSGCHADSVDAANKIIPGGKHLNGIVDAPTSMSCTGCHGQPPATGVHVAHMTDSRFRLALACDECHLVPPTGDTSHMNGVAALTFGPLATAGGAPAAFSHATQTCSGVYCHGDTLGAGGSATRPVWSPPAPAPIGCTSCHGAPPPGHISWITATTDCHVCHPGTVNVDGSINLAGGKHIDGNIDRILPATAACGTCHPAPPPTGAHAAHIKLTSLNGVAYGQEWTAESKEAQVPGSTGGGYSFGCGVCHPKNVARHGDGTVQVDLSPAGGAVDGVRILNGAGAAFDKSTGTCSNVYCHSSGQAAPTFATTPNWYGSQKVTCGDCHGNPPSYASGAVGSPAANSHIFLSGLGREAGHFSGLPGSSPHRSRHGQPTSFTTAEQGAVITCQTCHATTVDPANVSPGGGFFYLDTSITTQLPGGNASRLTNAAWKDTQCVTCHKAGGTGSIGTGKVLPLKHVNGVRDVVFDQRTVADLPGWSTYWATTIGLGTSAPTRPYFMTSAKFPVATPLPAGAEYGFDPAAPAGAGTATLSYQLTGTTYDPASKTCSNVACHLGKSATWGNNFAPTSATDDACTHCHN
jgi:predicted CxxxxCH...CXXCH cytochrome family protein